MNDSAPFLVIDLKIPNAFVFQTKEHLRNWIDDQKRSWAEILEDRERIVVQIKHPFERGRTLLNNVFNSATAYLDNPDEQLLGKVRLAFAAAYRDGGIPVQTTGVTEYLSNLRKIHGSLVAQSAFASFVEPANQNPGAGIDQSLPQVRIGVASASLFLLGMDGKIPESLNERLQKLLGTFEGILSATTSARQTFDETNAAHLAEFRKSADDQLASNRRAFDQSSAESQEMLKRVVSEIEATNLAFREQMHLKAPAEYWTQKAHQHRSNEKKIRKYLIRYAVAASVGLIVLLIGTALLAAYFNTNADTAIYLKFAAIGLIATTIVFWVGRVILRIFLSERHLATDAEERVTMVTTYLALSQDGKIEISDRALVLAPLFRSSSDGIVKDDGAPDVSLGAWLAKAVEPTRRS